MSIYSDELAHVRTTADILLHKGALEKTYSSAILSARPI